MGKKKYEKDVGQIIKEFMNRMVGDSGQTQLSSSGPSPALPEPQTFSQYGVPQPGGLRKFIFVDPTGPTGQRPSQKEAIGEIPDVPENAKTYLKDAHDEAVQSAFLVRNFYPMLSDSLGYSFRATRKVIDKDLQTSGIDAYGTREKSNKELEFLYVDEKCAFTKPNNTLQTFSFELYLKDQSSHEWKNGWFVRTNISTDYYLLLYPFLPYDKLEKGTLRDTDILAFEGIFIKRNAIIGYVKECGFEMQDLLDVQDAMRNSEQTSAPLKSGMRIQISNKLQEQPANLLIPKKTLLALCDNRYAIEPEGTHILDKSGTYTPAPRQRSEA